MENPILIPGWPTSWPCQNWTFRSLAELLKDKQLSCRVWQKSIDHVFETDCEHLNITLCDFCDWIEERPNIDNPLHLYDRRMYNCYIDYKYMKHMFDSVKHILNDVKWSDFGLSEFDGGDSTIWVGSEGSNTPCHQDSYGFNLVTQIQGRKMWVLFPPSDVEHLYPTRIPYEESSVFSQVNVLSPDMQEHPKFQHCHPVVVVLNPGQTLYVPNRWWHYVESLEPSISINVWVPLEQDKHQHLNEAITRCLVTSLIKDVDSSETSPAQSQLLNPTEELCSSRVNYMYMKAALEKVVQPPNCSGRRTSDGEISVAVTDKLTTDHFQAFQRWINQCEIIQSDHRCVCASKKRPSASGVSSCDNKKLKTEMKTEVNCSSSSSYVLDKTSSCCGYNYNRLTESSSESYQVKNAEETVSQDSIPIPATNANCQCIDANLTQIGGSNRSQIADIYHCLSPIQGLQTLVTSDQKLKLYRLSSLPFHVYQSHLHNKINHHNGQGTETDLQCNKCFLARKATGDTEDTLSNQVPLDQSSLKTSGKSSERQNATGSGTSQSCALEVSPCSQEKTCEIEFAKTFISSVLHPSVVNNIANILIENCLKSSKKKD